MPRRKQDQNTTQPTRGANGDGALHVQLSELIRSLMGALGTAYADQDTAPQVIEHLEQAKNSVLLARNGARPA